jgi:hypothetical protein
MKGGLCIKFNDKSKFLKPSARPEVKTENDIKVGYRTEVDGSKIAVRGGKILSRWESSLKKDANSRHETPKQKLNEYRQAAAEAVARKNKAARAHRKPSGAPTP